MYNPVLNKIDLFGINSKIFNLNFLTPRSLGIKQLLRGVKKNGVKKNGVKKTKSKKRSQKNGLKKTKSKKRSQKNGIKKTESTTQQNSIKKIKTESYKSINADNQREKRSLKRLLDSANYKKLNSNTFQSILLQKIKTKPNKSVTLKSLKTKSKYYKIKFYINQIEFINFVRSHKITNNFELNAPLDTFYIIVTPQNLTTFNITN